jgi:hypothetical protein
MHRLLCQETAMPKTVPFEDAVDLLDADQSAPPTCW